MIAPASTSRYATRVSAAEQREKDAPIQVRRLNRGAVHFCHQKDSVTGLYIGQSATLEMAGELQTLSAGDLLVLPRNMAVKATQVVDVWALEFLWEALTPFSNGIGSNFPAWRHFAAALGTPTERFKRYAVPEDERPTWQRCLQTLDQELRAQKLGYCETSKAHLTLLLVSLARLIEENLASLPLTDDPLVAKVLAYVEVHFREALTLGHIAARVHLSPAYLTTRVKAQIGQSVMEYVIERRMQEAEALLTTTDKPVSAVGEAVGYPEPSTFSRQFRRRHGLSPAAWREDRLTGKPTEKLVKQG